MSVASQVQKLPVHLQTLFATVDFIAGTPINSKPCFGRRYYVDKDSWTGAYYRASDSECQKTRGNPLIKAACDSLIEAYSSSSEPLRAIVKKKMLSLRKGVSTIHDTYASIEKEKGTATELSSYIELIDIALGEEVLIAEGIILKQPSEDGKVQSPSPSTLPVALPSTLPVALPSTLHVEQKSAPSLPQIPLSLPVATVAMRIPASPAKLSESPVNASDSNLTPETQQAIVAFLKTLKLSPNTKDELGLNDHPKKNSDSEEREEEDE